MGIIYHKLHRLRGRKSWVEIAEAVTELGGSQDGKSVSRVTLHELAEKPHKRAKPHLKAAIDQLHEQTFGSPFPGGANRLLELYRSITQDEKNFRRQREIQHLEAFVEDHLQRHATQDLYNARLHWLMGNIKEDKVRRARDEGTGDERLHRNAAIQHYRIAAQLVEQHQLHNEAFKLKQNIFACFANSVQPGARHQHVEVRKCIQDIGIVETAMQALDAEPFQWLTARVALMCIAVRRAPGDLTVARELFERLVQANTAFIDPEYQPDYFLALAADQDTHWLTQEVLTESTLKAIRRKMKLDT
ncbi:MAG: hypothetical protein HPY82_04155 [Gammaproteobacteria bacterium]|nr:hypothetical protein [Gammaproteobacteria bacterium]